MKAVLISIQPKWCELIATCEKMVEVRKTRPKLKTPFKVYIYCTKDNTFAEKTLRGFDDNGKAIYYKANKGKVIGEFVCRGIMQPYISLSHMAKKSCLTEQELIEYSNGKTLYGWNISDLVIYDTPKELGEFVTICRNAYCQNDWGNPTWFCKDGYSSCAVVDKEKEYPYNEECIYFDCPSVGGESCEYEDYAYCNCDGLKPITRPPQSWCYVERLDNG